MKLWVYSTAWRLDSADRPLVAAGDEQAHIEEAVKALVGKTVSTIDITAPSADTTIGFQTCRLRIFPVYFGDNADSATWTVHTVPSKRQLVVGPGANWSIRTRQAATQKRGDE